MEYRDPILQIVRRKSYYVFQKLTRIGIDSELEETIHSLATAYLEKLEQGQEPGQPKTVLLEHIDFQETARYSVVRDDIYRRFVVDDAGPDTDKFDRRGRWIPRGSMVYLDGRVRDYVKVFDKYFCHQGEGRFLKHAFDSGLYDFLCPNLSYVIEDADGDLRGYAISEGRQLTQGEFDRYVGRGLRELIFSLTERTGLYFLDLTCNNVILNGDRLSFIDLESVLPTEWFEKDIQFSRDHFDEIDIGWPIQMKWHSPRWYRNFLRGLSV